MVEQPPLKRMAEGSKPSGPTKKSHDSIPGSSNGRTADSGLSYRGSNPQPGATADVCLAHARPSSLTIEVTEVRARGSEPLPRRAPFSDLAQLVEQVAVNRASQVRALQSELALAHARVAQLVERPFVMRRSSVRSRCGLSRFLARRLSCPVRLAGPGQQSSHVANRSSTLLRDARMVRIYAPIV